MTVSTLREVVRAGFVLGAELAPRGRRQEELVPLGDKEIPLHPAPSLAGDRRNSTAPRWFRLEARSGRRNLTFCGQPL